MKIILSLMILALVLPMLLAHPHGGKWKGRKHWNDQDDDERPQFKCRFKTESRTRYWMGNLYLHDGNAYSATDDQGDNIYFNLCGDLSKVAEGSIGCDPTAAVCVMTTSGSFINAGRPNGDWSQTDDQGAIQITYAGGDLCADGVSNFQTTIMLNCTEDDETEGLQVVNVDYNDCQLNIQATSKEACPRKRAHGWRHGDRHGNGSGVALFFVTMISCCCLTMCCCACIRRRRMCKQRMMNRQGYQQVPQQVPQQPQNVQIQQPVQAPLQPYVVPFALPQQQQFGMPQFQYFQPPSYFVYPQNVPTAPQAPQIPMVNLSQANDAHISIRENTTDQDEKLARELQAKFDNE